MPKRQRRRAEIRIEGARPYATRGMQCHGTALVHERRRLMKAGQRLLQAFLAAEGLVIRTRIWKGDGQRPIRIYRGPRPA